MPRSTTSRLHDVLIIGAGAAGLAAAAELARHRRSVLVLEARDRIGGRCWTRHESGLAVPVEMGPEFIHGRPEATFSLMRRAGIPAIERAGSRWFRRKGSVEPRQRGPFLTRIQEAMEAVGPPRRDMSFRAYVDHRLRSRLTPEEQAYALRMAEGYDAAFPEQLSARAIVEEWTGEGTANDASFRPRGGYGALMRALEESLERGAVRLRRVVRVVRWQRGRVEVEGTFRGKPFRESAARAIIALPLGVLQQPPRAEGALRFAPGLTQEKRRALAGLASGPVMRIVLRMRSRFWEKLEGGRYRDAGFFQSVDAAFPTFWTALPARAPLLVAWAGGPRAKRMARVNDAERVRRAAASLQSFFGDRVDVASQLETAWLHDWQRDPYARGAYSWVKVGGGSARKTLAAPLAKALYFAGEATDYEGEAGTVAGALQSGMRAAREILESE